MPEQKQAVFSSGICSTFSITYENNQLLCSWLSTLVHFLIFSWNNSSYLRISHMPKRVDCFVVIASIIGIIVERCSLIIDFFQD
ncbi:MAG: hypothetical protein A3D31_01545 [Candidatus Fluviicola riflensis]|nr:MAG: hypothetical protein CHH17_03995 [Candidatus Fluviicola riflensis]OGS76285.1 MAG: hypothetical protein A3D31_01545 [Candidatus Fluviicola riflensis]OGS83171.1 MAG: hypothetical protein A2724_00295 [Fluviicola sp. RIFCSPHIGHO2_01_FULL_43_53]OGS83817.1 MAG: hypothetical protein A3E30_18150 [Fluviicola sp. RIFCSPHIGHO2_12_FULL_43_24]